MYMNWLGLPVDHANYTHNTIKHDSNQPQEYLLVSGEHASAEENNWLASF